MGAKVLGTFAPEERKFHGTKVLRLFAARERMFHGTKVPLERKFSVDFLLPGMKVQRNEKSRYQVFDTGVKYLWYFS